MTVKEIMQQACTLSGREDMVDYLALNGSATEDTILAVNVMVIYHIFSTRKCARLLHNLFYSHIKFSFLNYCRA